MSAGGVTAGVLGGRWRATITPWGAVVPWDGSPTLDWHVAADDRWHTPAVEAAVRQTRIDGTPVTETRMRIPHGDAVQRVYSVADGGGMTLVEVTNESPLPIAVAFTRSDVLTARPPTDVPVQGVELPPATIVLPAGHQSTVTVGLPHGGGGAGTLPAGLPPVLQVVRGWTAMVDRAGRMVVPDPALLDAVAGARCELALAGPDHPDDDPAAFLVGVGQLVRMGEVPGPWLLDVAHAVELMAKRGGEPWRVDTAFTAADVVLHRADERRARRDLARTQARWSADAGPVVEPEWAPDDVVGLLAWVDRWCVSASGGLLPLGLPTPWLGAPVEVYDAPVGGASKVSFALRWHGDRPAVLWEVTGDPVTLSAPVLAPRWVNEAPSGEALWPVPPNAVAVAEQPTPPSPSGSDDGMSFS
jgi:hypothetical protein